MKKLQWKYFVVTVLVLLLLTPAVMGMRGLPVTPLGDDPPTGIHLYWNDDLSTTIVISWKTLNPDSGDMVYYDTESKKGMEGDPSELYAYSAEGTHHTIDDLGGYIHDVKLTGLEPGKTYYFVCGGPGGFEEERKFKTLPENPDHVRFVFGGDSREGATDFPWGRDEISKLMATYDPDFVIHCGDFVRKPFRASHWDDWFNHMDETWIDSEGYTIPIIPFLGNHEVGTKDEFMKTKEDAKFYFQYFNMLPEPQTWYSLDITPYIHFTALNSETYTGPHSEQYEWADEDLSKAKDVTWKFVGFHRPAFDPRGKGTSEYFLPLLDKYHVDIVLNGDVHLYERLQPMNVSSYPGEYVSFDKGTVHIVSGGWGAPLYMHYPLWYDACGPIAEYNFTVFDVTPTTLHMQAIDVNGNVIDEFTINKELSEPQIVVRAKATSDPDDVSGPAPLTDFGPGDFPPVVGMSKVGKGTVVASGTAWSCENGGWVKGEYDVFLDILFQKMVEGAKKILWYEGYNARFTTEDSSDLISALKDMGYEVVGDSTEPITMDLLKDYDILVIPQLRLGSGYDGGDPSLLPWDDVYAIKDFVEGGKGLLVMDACDYGGNNFNRVQNKILSGVGAGLTLQSDCVYDWVNNWKRGWYPIVEVDPESDIGKAYVNRTGKTEIQLYELCSVVVSPPTYLESVSGGERTIVDGRKKMADARVIIETKEDAKGVVGIQNLGNSGDRKLLKCVDISTDIPEDEIVWPVTVEVYYTDKELEEWGLTNESSLWLYYWDPEQGMWRLCQESGVNAERNCVVGNASHFTKFAIMGGPIRVP